MNTAPGSRDGFLLMTGVESSYHVVHRVCEAEKHPNNPVLPLGDMHEWDASQARPWASPTVIWDDEERVFKTWYSGSDVAPERWTALGYATSSDGVTWEKPQLGLHEFRGSSANNIVLMGYGPVIKDTMEPDPAKRYKMILRGPRPRTDNAVAPPPTPGRGMRVAYSPDGIHWNEGPSLQMPQWRDRSLVYGDPGALCRDDLDPDPSRRYKLVWQARVPIDKPDKEEGRAKFLSYGPDIEHMRAADHNPILSPADGFEYEDHHVMLAPYGGAWAMPYEYAWYLPNGYGVYGTYYGDIRLAVSADGERFTRIDPHQTLIRRGGNTEWDGGLLVIADKPAIKDGMIHLFYGGNGEEWTSWPSENTPDAYPFGSTGQIRVSRLGLARLREDGWTCLESADRETPSYVVTTPIGHTDRATVLTVNVGDVRQNRSWVEVEVLDPETLEPVEGFGRQDCGDLCTDGWRQVVHWRGGSLQQLQGERFRLKFWIYGSARLYAYGFDPA